MTRHDPKSQAGWVNWPADGDGKGFQDDGEGGMSAYACWTPLGGEPNKISACCDGLSILMQEAEVFIGASGPGEDSYTEQGWREEVGGMPAGYYTDAVITLGSTGGSWFNPETRQRFKVTWYDLNEQGQRTILALTDLYGFEPDILTFLDT